MSLRSKIVYILVTVVLLYAGLDNGLLRVFFGQVFGRWERQGAEEGLAHVRGRLDSELRDLVGKGKVLAGVTALGRFIEDPDPAFVASDLGRPALERAGVDLLYLCDARGKVLWGSVLDPGTREPVRLVEFPREALSPNNPALVFRDDETLVSGVLMTKLHPLLFCTIPIPHPDPATESGSVELLTATDGGFRHPGHGAIVMGRFLGPELKERIVAEELALAGQPGERAALHVELLESGDPNLPPELARADGDRHLAPGEDGLLHAYERIGALRTSEPIVLHVALDRAIEAHRRLTVNYVLLSTLIGGLLILFVLLRLLQRIVVAPLSALSSKALEIGRRDDTTIRLGMDRSDEIGQLAGEFDRMLEKLARSREQVVQTARMAGRSEIATGVLHNVGNVLNSVNVAANLAVRRTEDFSLGDLEMLVGVLQSHERDLAAFIGEDPRGKHLIPFLKELTGTLGNQRQAIHQELKALNEGIDHIAELVRAQQSHAGAQAVLEMASLESQIEGALSLCRQGLSAHGVVVERAFAGLPSVRVDKHKLMEILVNLIQNAGQAMAEHGGERKLVLRLTRVDPDKARIEVCDSGIGIAPENLTRVFQHGFTTKASGHGFGLHVSANAATEMGAKLHATSAGPGRGATFILDIPMETEAAQAAA